ncbi:YdgH/BhsA/McbA-like domain containing protein [Kosakonia sp. MH5]|uniref:YdgH/BhsA/McbA-like domain containing protein n=1 Tax=Kosakonia sp. MH5 TaxID=2202822 RepID=UPI0013749EA1|nr:YdgH/BhsA/McbA-like domain containing protein [Kosakonia sp. MH5]NCF08845.1 DUF1471 domain-containing protein [Kosakonia sp. MH5]
MKIIKHTSVIVVAALSLMSASVFAQSVTATAQTLSDAEAKIAAKAQQQSAQYTIIEASSNDIVHMTAKLHK